MPRQRQVTPELHQPVMDTIGRLYAAHSQGGGSLLLETIVHLFAPNLSDSDKATLTARGSLRIAPLDASSGTFANTGGAVQLKPGRVTILVPTEVSGTYQSSAEAFSLTFDSGHTIEGRLLFFRARLKDISADARTLNVSLSNEALDQCIIHAN